MSATSILSFGTLFLASIITWYFVQALRQAQRTALAMEELLVDARPRLQATTDQIRSVLARADALLDRADKETSGLGGFLGAAAQFASGRGSGGGSSKLVRFLSILSGIAVSVERTCSIIAGSKASPQARKEK